ncbi:hypothetical protein GQ457_14G016520 [Hibiscus cannabinus]
MTDEEKKSYFDIHVEQKQAYMDWKSQGKVKPEVKKEVSLRCSLKKLSFLFKEIAEGTNAAKINASTDFIMDAFEKFFSHLNEMKVTLETGVERKNKIEETLETLKDESKHVIDQVVGLSANMLYMKKDLCVIDAKFGIGLEEEESMGEKTKVHESVLKAEDDTFVAVLVNDVIHLNDDQVAFNYFYLCIKVIINFGQMYLSVSDTDTLRPCWVNSMVIDVVGWKIIVEDIRGTVNQGEAIYLAH